MSEEIVGDIEQIDESVFEVVQEIRDLASTGMDSDQALAIITEARQRSQFQELIESIDGLSKSIFYCINGD